MTALPLMLMAQRQPCRLSGETAAAMRGDAVFELAAGELRYAECVSLSEKPWKRIDGDTFGSFSDVEIGIRAAGERSLWLTVRVNQGEELLYERTGRVELLNVPFYGTGRLEGSERTGRPPRGSFLSGGLIHRRRRFMRETEILKGLEGGENMAVQFVDNLLSLGLREKASDIHLEPGEEQMTVRMRTDGQLKVCAAVEMRHHPMILTRVKVMADMDIAEKRLPQDGHIRASIQGKLADLRVSVIPTIHGEKAVLRFLNTDISPRQPGNLRHE